jgi:hypothetical protein
MKKNNEQLYESIMKEVSRTIKKNLNENSSYYVGDTIREIIDTVGENMFYEDLLEMIPDNVLNKILKDMKRKYMMN